MDANLKPFRDRLLAEQKETIEAIQQAQQSAAPVTLDQSSVGRVSRIDAIQQQALAQGIVGRLLTRKRKIDAALARVDAGSFGLCCSCQDDLEPQRLNADPAVVFCRTCAEVREK